MEHPRVSVVMAASNAEATIDEALASIEAQDYPGDLEVVVAAADAPTANAASRAGALVIDNPSRSTPAGLNLAISKSTGEIVVRLDAHAYLPTTYVTAVVAALEEGRGAVVGGMQVPRGSSFWENAIAAAMSSKMGSGDARYRVGGRASAVETVYLGSFRRQTYEAVGGYDERFTRSQDYELNHRIMAAGGTIWFEPSLRVGYTPRASLPALASQYFQYGSWKRYFSRTHPGSLRIRQMAPPTLVIVLGLAMVLSLVWPWALLVVAAYGIGVLGAGAATVRRVGLAAVGVPAALVVMHVSWGAGFLYGPRRDR